MNRKIRVGAVNYLNTKPLIYGFEQGLMKDQVDLLLDYPSKIAEKLKNDDIDVGLVPVAVIPELKEYYIISDYCIGCDGKVGSVCLFSEVEINKIERILLDYQSKTSVDLLKVLLREHWKIAPELITTSQDYRQDIKGTTAGMMIGDRALEQRNISLYQYDLGAEWKNFTGMPFVFAAWISNKKLAQSFIEDFNRTNLVGLEHIENVVHENPYRPFDLEKYYTEYISYELDEEKKKAMEFFLNKVFSNP